MKTPAKLKQITIIFTNIVHEHYFRIFAKQKCPSNLYPLASVL